MLDAPALQAIERYFVEHPVLNRYLPRISVYLTGSHALGLGGIGADIDLKVIAAQRECEKIQQELRAAGRIAAEGEPEEELTDIVGDYSLESLECIRERVRDYRDLTQVFIYGHLVYVLGAGNLAQDLILRCHTLPDQVCQQERQREETRLSDAVYAFLRSFQTADEVGRSLSRANVMRSSMRLAFLTEAKAPPYDKHLFRLLPGLKEGDLLAESVRWFMRESRDSEEERYSSVAGSNDWHEMYRCAEGTPVMEFLAKFQTLLGSP